MSSQTPKVRSKAWYLLPIFFHLIGGVIVYFAIRSDDPQKAKRCLVLGLVLLGINLLAGFALMDSFSNPKNMFSGITNDSKVDLGFSKNSVEVRLDESAKLLAFQWEPIVIPIQDIKSVSDQFPKQTSSDIRNPGTYVPGTVKAGTYHTQDGDTEFWFTKNGENSIIVIELKNQEFDRIVLESEKSDSWRDTLNRMVAQR